MTAPVQIKRYPIRGAIWGLLLGLGVAIYLLIFSVITFGDWVSTAIAVAAGVVVGVLWAMFAPPRKPKGAPPAQVGGGYVPAGQPIAATPVQQPPAQPAQPAAPIQQPAPQPAQPPPVQQAPAQPPPTQPAPAPAPAPAADDLQPSFLVDDDPPAAPPEGGAHDTVVIRPDDDPDDGGGAFSQRS